ncbi:hypothetical protein GWK47_042674 [Chionoecetes opilio]|uniref:Uncharacterized protein n=1 Tax=Chionoecetes opilio TaxID=41210 RepID=A0A8J4YI41_CHIOP|nr:hypothetical protein GWK47_042674 [Chionoecetes opilio]
MTRHQPDFHSCTLPLLPNLHEDYSLTDNQQSQLPLTVSFRKSDGLDAQTQVRLVVYDVRERVTNTTTQLGQATASTSTISLGGLHETGRSRLSLLSPACRNVGFITISAWTLEAESMDASHTPSNATPHHQPVSHHESPGSLDSNISTTF